MRHLRVARRAFRAILFLPLLIWVLKGPVEAVRGAAPKQPPPQTLEGDLSIRESQGPVLKAGTKEYRLSSADADIPGLLKDQRMAGRRLLLEGQFKGTNGFDVQRLYVLRAGKRYRVVYYCEVC